MSLHNRWRAAGLPVRLVLLVALALALTLLGETLLNLRAMSTQGLAPVAVPLAQASVEGEGALQSEADGLHLTLAAGQTVRLSLGQLNLPAQTAALTLAGQGAVQAAFSLTDQASTLIDYPHYSVPCVAGDAALGTGYAYLRSAGDAGSLYLTLQNLQAEEAQITVTQVTVNAPVPVRYQPVRMALGFAALLMALCALFLRGVQPGSADLRRPAHRLILAVPLAVLIALNTWLMVWIQPQTPLFAGRTLASCTGERKDGYAALFAALCNGRLAHYIDPTAELLALHNPYDVSQRWHFRTPFLHDFALYNGQYYIYFGVAPLVTVYAPFYLLTGMVPTARDATALLAPLAMLLVAWAVVGLQRRYAKDAGIFSLSLTCVAAVFASGVPLLAASADTYYLAVLSMVAFSAGAIATGLQASAASRPWRRRLWYAISGACFALVSMSRVDGLLMLFAVLAPLYVADLRGKRARGWEALAFLAPAVLGIGAQLCYNALRFGSPLDFGAAHQLTVTDVHTQRVSLWDVPQALHAYLLQAPIFTRVFPYITLDKVGTPAAGHFLYTNENMGLLWLPLMWGILLWPLHGLQGGAARALRRERSWALLLPLGVSLMVMVVSFGMAGVLIRYTADHLLFFALAGACGVLPVMARRDTPERRALAALCTALCVGSIVMGTLLVFANERNYLMQQAPSVYYGLVRMFFPY